MVHRGIVVIRRVRASIVVAVLVGFALTSVGVTSASASEADTIAALVNQDRASAGLPGLIHNPAMDSVALQWANQMGAANSMVHNPSYSTQIPSGWSRAGENIAMGQPTPSDMYTAWMNSAGHRANILGDFTDIGIAFVTVNGTTWGVEDFGKYAGHAGAPLPVAPVAAATPTDASTPEPTARTKETARAVEPPATPSETPGPESVLLSASRSAAQRPFPIGYVIGGILVVLGIGGGIYGQRMRIRGRKPPGA
jgi:hypothetical protein